MVRELQGTSRFLFRFHSNLHLSFRNIGHFTVMVHENNTAVGCGMSTYKTISNGRSMNTYLFACNYATTNRIGCPVYNAGTKASGCPEGVDKAYPNLCKPSAKINPNVYC
jgi:hypothetical protein